MYSVVICFCAELEYKLSHEAAANLFFSQEPITSFLVVATFTLDERIVYYRIATDRVSNGFNHFFVGVRY